MAVSSVSIVVPAFNEQGAIASVLTKLVEAFPQHEIIAVNDGSTDNTESEIKSVAGAKLLSHEYQRGYGAALATGTRAAKGAYILFCDGDGQHRIEDVRKLIEEAEGYDLVVGARGSDSHQPLIRRPGKFIMRWFANTLAGTIIPDLNSGLRIFRRDVLLKYLHLMPEGFSFSTTSTFAILKSNRRYKYVPIKVEKRVGKSTVSQFRHGPQALMLMLRLSVLFEPLKVFLSVAGFLFVLSLLSFGVDLFGSEGVLRGGGIADTTVLLSIATIIVFMSGLLCDQVSALRREKHE